MKKLLPLLLLIPIILLTSCEAPEELRKKKQIQENKIRDTCLSNSGFTTMETSYYIDGGGIII